MGVKHEPGAGLAFPQTSPPQPPSPCPGPWFSTRSCQEGRGRERGEQRSKRFCSPLSPARHTGQLLPGSDGPGRGEGGWGGEVCANAEALVLNAHGGRGGRSAEEERRARVELP